MTLTTIGYGDIPVSTHAERMFACLAMLAGASVYAYVVGAVCGIVSTLNEAGTEYNQTFDTLNSYMTVVKYPGQMRNYMRRYFINCRSMHAHKYNQMVLEHMSPGLRAE